MKVLVATGRNLVLVPARNSSTEIEMIMQNVVADNSRYQQDTKLVGFVLLLYKNPDHRLLLLLALLEDLDEIMYVDGNKYATRSILKVAIQGIIWHTSNSWCPIKLEYLSLATFTKALLSVPPKKKREKRKKRRQTRGTRGDNSESEDR